MKRRYTYRAYPTPMQQRELARLYGCCRLVYNSVISDRQAIYETGLHTLEESGSNGKSRRVFDANRQAAYITTLKREKSFLGRVSYDALVQAMRDAETAFKNFFDSSTGKRKGTKVGFPGYKSRFDYRQAARFTKNSFKVKHDRVYLAKIGEVRFKLSRPLPSKPSSVTVIHKPDGTYHVSFVVDVEQAPIMSSSGRHVAVDLGVRYFASLAYDDLTRERIENPKHIEKLLKKLAREQRVLSRRQAPNHKTGRPGSRSYEKQRKRVAKIHARIANARKDFLHKTALTLVEQNATVAVVSFNLRELMQRNSSNRLNRAVADTGARMFTDILASKAPDRVTTVGSRDTTRTCSVCGVAGEKLPLHVRVWVCGNCGSRLDRDYNTAVNVMSAAGRAESLNAGGSGVRLQLARAEAAACNPGLWKPEATGALKPRYPRVASAAA